MTVRARSLGQLDGACPGRFRPGTAADQVDGAEPEAVIYPLDTQEVSVAVRVAASLGLSVVAKGAGTKLDWGGPPSRVGLLMDLSGMGHILEHARSDLVVRAQAGTTMAKLSESLADDRQWFPVDEVVPGSTLGGVVATGVCGPTRYLNGSVRDLVLGVTAVRADGTVVRAGSKVVKNVAGYDLSKLFTGSYGTLVVLTELTLKLKPLPEVKRFISALYTDKGAFVSGLFGLLGSQAEASAIELEQGNPDQPVRLSALVEGRPAAVELRAAQLADILGDAEVSAQPPPGWGALPGPTTFKLTSTLSRLPELAEEAARLARALGAPARIAGSAGAGVLFLGVPGDIGSGELGALLGGLREASRDAGGHAVLLRAPARSKASLDVWGPVPGLELMRRVKERFDPGHLLSPGRFVGGI